MNNNYVKEQKELLTSFLEVHCFKNWKILPSQRTGEEYVNSLEMMVSPVCNTSCSYCYMKNYSDFLYPCSCNKEILLQNCHKIMKWLYKENYYPGSIEIFSGEFFNLPFWKEYLDIIFNFLGKMPEGKCIPVIIPTNGTFFFSEEKTQELQNYFDFLYEKGFIIFLSISVDGKYLDNETRPLKNGKLYNDEFYNRMFTFGARNELSYHPMIGAKGIEKWIENFDWYIDNIQKYYKIPKKEALKRLYLLEVRNPDWKSQELKEFENFLNHIMDVLFEDCSSKEEKFNLLLNNNLNILAPLISSIGRGLGCSFQQCLDIRMGDLAIVQCHRTAYEELLGGYLNISEKGKLNIKPKNVNSYILSNSFDFKYMPKCEDCPISSFCNGPCIGCNYEVNKDLYTVVPTVCDLEYSKILTMICRIQKEGLLDRILGILHDGSSKNQMLKKYQLRNFKEYLKIKDIKENI